MYLRHLEYLRLVVEHGSFAAAAQAGGVTQPAISHGMKQLQLRLGQALFTRAGRQRVPTEFALRVAREGAALADQVSALAQAPPRRVPAGLLRVGLTSSAALVCGRTLHAAWCTTPTRQLQMHSADEGRLLARLARHELDLVICPRPRGLQAPALQGELLYEVQPQAYARPKHPLARARSLADLQHAAWAVVGPSVSGPVDVLGEAFRVRRMAPPRVAVSCADYPSLLRLVAHTDLLAVLPHPVLLDGGDGAGLVPLRLRETLPLYGMWLFHALPVRDARHTVRRQLLLQLRDSPGDGGNRDDGGDGR